MLDRSTTRFIGLGNYARLAGSDRFWMLVAQTCLSALIAVALSAIIGFVVAHLVNNIPPRRQRAWRGMLLLPWVIPLAMSVPAWRLLFDPSFSAFNWILDQVGAGRINWFVDAGWARFAVILVTVWSTAPFFLVMYLASLKSVPEELYEAASIDGATWWQRMLYITLPMMRPVIAVTTLLSDCHLCRLHHRERADLWRSGSDDPGAGHGGVRHRHPRRQSPDGRRVALSMVPILAVAAMFLLRGIAKRAE